MYPVPSMFVYPKTRFSIPIYQLFLTIRTTKSSTNFDFPSTLFILREKVNFTTLLFFLHKPAIRIILPKSP